MHIDTYIQHTHTTTHKRIYTQPKTYYSNLPLVKIFIQVMMAHTYTHTHIHIHTHTYIHTHTHTPHTFETGYKTLL